MQIEKSDICSWLWVLALVLLLQAMPKPATANDMTPNEAQAGSLLWKMEQGYATATALNTKVDMKISGLVARVSVQQEFRNEGSDWVEGIYVFPLPDKAAVDRMRLHIGDRVIEGEIREKEQAKKEYEQAKKAGKKTSLVQQQRANLFTTSVANVAPGELVVVEVEYLEDLRYEDGRFSIRFPMTLTPRYISGQSLPDKQGNGWSADTDRVPDAIAPFGGRVLARGGDYKILEGPEKFHRFVVIEFPSMADAIACHDSQAYQEAAAFRKSGAGEVELVIVDSFKG